MLFFRSFYLSPSYTAKSEVGVRTDNPVKTVNMTTTSIIDDNFLLFPVLSFALCLSMVIMPV